MHHLPLLLPKLMLTTMRRRPQHSNPIDSKMMLHLLSVLDNLAGFDSTQRSCESYHPFFLITDVFPQAIHDKIGSANDRHVDVLDEL